MESEMCALQRYVLKTRIQLPALVFQVLFIKLTNKNNVSCSFN